MKTYARAIYKKIYPVLLVMISVAIFGAVDNAVSQSSGTLSLESIHALSMQQAQMQSGVKRSVNSEPAATQAQADRFTQSQAHMSLPDIKKLIAANYDTKPYDKFIAAILEREKKYANDYVFYHGADNVWRVPQDLYTRLYFHVNKLPANLMENFVFLRFDAASAPSNIQNFLLSQLKTGGLINDHELGSFMFAANLALFGNVGTQPECTWQYFIKSRGHLVPNRAIYEQIMDTFGFPHTYINELISLVDLYKTTEQTIIQIFIPQDKVDEIGYISWIKGIPAHKKTMDMVLQSVEDKTFPKTQQAIVHYAELFQKEQEKNLIFKNLVERVSAGDFNLNYFLHFYRNYPEKIEGINNYQARLVFTSSVLLNPRSGVKIFRCSTAKLEQLKKYQQKFDEIFNKIILKK